MKHVTPARVLGATFVAFLIYAYPGYLGWDSEAHLLQSRSGIYTDGHPPIIAFLWKLIELVITGPFGMLVVQAATLLVGLYLILVHVVPKRPAAIVASALFLFPPVSGVTGLICKDSFMAGFVVLGIGLALRRRNGLALACLVVGTAMRWNSLAATFTLVVLLMRFGDVTGWRRYARAAVAWIAVTAAAYAINTLLTDRRVYMWYGTHALMDIAGTLRYLPDPGDAQIEAWLEGVPLIVHDHLHDRFVATYNATDYRQLTPPKGTDPIFVPPESRAGREAVARAWREIVLGHPAEYMHYRLDNFRLLLRIDPQEAYSQVYVWFTIIATPESIPRLQHDASPSRVQAHLRSWAIWLSNTWVYYPYLYIALAILLLPFALRGRLAGAFVLSGLAYEAAWFFLDPTADFRYSQWSILATLVGLAVVLGERAYISRDGV